MTGTKIKKIEGIPLRIPFAKSFTMAAAHQATRDEVEVFVVRITTEDGVVGVGETQAWRRQGSGETLQSLHSKLQEIAVPALTGLSVIDIGMAMKALSDRLAGGLYLQAAIGDALYDAKARSLGLSVAQLLGGGQKQEIPVGIALGITGDTPMMIEAAERAYEEGYRHLRIKIGIDARKDLANLQALRTHFNDRVFLRADANGNMRYGEALRLLSQIEALDLEFVEQPLPSWDIAGMARLAASVRVPLSADESISDPHSLAVVGAQHGARVIQTKSAKNGGIHGISKLWTLAEALGIDIFPGNHPSTSLNVAAVAQLTASWATQLLPGDFQTGLVDMLADDIVEKPVRVENGCVQVPQGPGMGVRLSEEKLARYRIDKS